MNIKKLLSFTYILPLYVVSSLFFGSCGDKNNPKPYISNSEINQWVTDSMRYWYYWNNNIPSNNNLNLNLEPKAFFETLLKRPDDRFSWIQNRKELEDNLSGVIKTTGLSVSFFRIGDSNKAAATVKYVHKGSPADKAGVKRGDIFIEINGQPMTISNGTVQNASIFFGNDPFMATKGIINDDIISRGDEVPLVPIEGFQEQAIHLDTILTTNDGTKVAYLFYNRFLENQAQALLDAFRRFKAAGVTELIIDERYNTGGSVSVASLLSALTHKNFNLNSTFILYEFNSNLKFITFSYKDLLGSSVEGIINSGNLGLERVFFLATEGSASASELVINNLKPFMGTDNVIHIGEYTVGKDDGSITISNKSSRFENEFDWAIQPIVLKYKNSNGEGGFINGLKPDYEVSETIPFAPMGSKEDPLIAKALGIIDPSMAPTPDLQMSVGGKRKKTINLPELKATNKTFLDVRPLDVSKTLQGETEGLNIH